MKNTLSLNLIKAFALAVILFASTLNVSAQCSITVAASSNVYCSPGGTAVTLTASGASTYSWSPSTGLSATTGNSVTAAPSETTTYTVTGTDGNGCISTASIDVTVAPSPENVTISGYNAGCQNYNLYLSASATGGSGPLSYSWSTPGSGSNPTGENVQMSTYLGGLQPFTVTVTDGVCTTSVTKTIPIDTPAAPVAFISGQTKCVGDSVTFFSKVNISTYKATWTYRGGGGVISEGGKRLTIKPVSQSNQGQVMVVWKSANGGCSPFENNAQLSITPLPATPSITGSSPVCEGKTIQLQTPSVTGAVYNWTGPNGFASTNQNPSVAATAAAAGTYNLSITKSGCTSASASKPVNVTLASYRKDTITACDSFLWHGNNYAVSGDYTYKTTTAAGCDSTEMLHLIVSNPKTTDSVTVCADSYSWRGNVYTGSGVYKMIISNPSGCDSVATLVLNIAGVRSEKSVVTCSKYPWNGTVYTASGDYAFKTLNRLNCDSVAILHLTIASPIVTTYSISKPLCYGASNGAISVAALGGTAPYQFRLGTTGNYQSSSTFDSLKSGKYIVYVLDSAGCTAITASISVSQPSPLAVTYAIADAACYGTATGKITVNVCGGQAPYQYRLGTTGSFTSSNVFDALSAGTYVVYVNDTSGCTATSASIVVSQAGPVTGVAKTSNARCYGDSGSVEVTPVGGTPPYSFTLSATGSYQPSNRLAAKAGSYKAYIQDAAGCIGTTSAFIIYQPAAIAPVSNITNATCPGLSDGAVTINTTGGVGPYLYKFAAATSYVANNTYTSLKAGNYLLNVMDGKGCNAAKRTVIIKNNASACAENKKSVQKQQTAGSDPKPVSLNVVISPNPSATSFHLTASAGNKGERLAVRILTADGVAVDSFNTTPEATVRFGSKLIAGTYFVEVRQGGVTRKVKVIKTK